MSSDFPQNWIAAGLFDPDAPGSSERLELLRGLGEIGMGPEAFVGLSTHDFPRAINERIRQPGERVPGVKAREVIGMDEQDFITLSRASGYDPDGDFAPQDIEVFKSFNVARSLFSDDELTHFVRVLGSSMAKIADAATSLFRIDLGAELESRGSTELEWAKVNHEATQLLDTVSTVMETLFLHQLDISATRSDLGRDMVHNHDNASTLKLAIGFVDLVGYTPIAHALPPDELGRFVQKFEAQAYDLVAAQQGRVVKLIGDEVMFVAVDPSDACKIAESLIEAFGGAETASRGGLAYGEVVARGGDYYGRVVNLAARVADTAIKGEILVDEATASAVGPTAFEPAGRRQLKGFAEPVRLLSLRAGPQKAGT